MLRGVVATATVLGLILGLLTWEFIALVLSTMAFLLGLLALYKAGHAVRLVGEIQDAQSERIDLLTERRNKGV